MEENNMADLYLDKEMMKRKSSQSTIWGVPIKTKLNAEAKRKLKKEAPNEYQMMVQENKAIEVIIQKILNNQQLDSEDQLRMKNRVLGDWTIKKANAEGIDYLLAIYYQSGKQKIVSIYDLKKSKVIDATSGKTGKKRVRWDKGESLVSIPEFEPCAVNNTIVNLGRGFSHPQRLIFQSSISD